MAQAAVKAPPLKEYPVIPILAPGAMAASKPYAASDKMNEALGFPGKLPEDWKERALAKMGELLKKYRGLRVFLDACVHCGACTDKCQFYLGTADPKNMPVLRAELLRSVYRGEMTRAGRLLGRRDAYPLDAEELARACADTGCLLELNGNPERMDLPDAPAQAAAVCGGIDAVRHAADDAQAGRADRLGKGFGVPYALRG